MATAPASDWKQVRSKKSATKVENAERMPSPEEKPRMELYAEDWTHKVMTELQFATNGVYLTANQKEAEALAPKLRSAKHAVALLSISKLAHATHSEEVVFRVRQKVVSQGKEQIRERLLRGYLSNYGPTWVRARMQVATLKCPQRTDATTTVVLLSSRRTAVTDSVWQEIKQYTTVKEIREAMKRHASLPQTVIDIFNLQRSDQHIAVRLRILKKDLQQWLTCELPFAVHPLEERESSGSHRPPPHAPVFVVLFLLFCRACCFARFGRASRFLAFFRGAILGPARFWDSP